MLITDQDLQRRHQRGHPHRHREHHARPRQMRIAQQVPGADGADHQRGGEIGRQHHVDEAVGEGRIEDHLEPVDRDELAVGVDGIAGRRLHPGIGREDPECRDQRAHRDHQGGEEMQLGADALEAEQHYAEEAGFEEERGEHLIGHQGADHRSDLVGIDRPVGAELIGHHDAGHDAHRKGDGEDLEPVIEDVEIAVAAGPQPQRLEHRKVGGKPDREGGEDDVEGDREGELRARQLHRIQTEHPHRPSLPLELLAWPHDGRLHR